MHANVTMDNYYKLRNELVEKNSNFLGVVLRDDELRLDKKLKILVEDCRIKCGGVIPCNKPVIANPAVWDSALYDFCLRLPKGGDLHVHACALMPAAKLVDFLAKRRDIFVDKESFYLYLPADANENCLPLGEALENGIIDRSELLAHWTVLGAGESDDIWQYFEKLFISHDALDSDMSVLYDYYVAAFSDCVKNGIFHLEIHTLLSLNQERTFALLGCMREAYYAVRRLYPELTVRIIGSSKKMLSFSLEKTEVILQHCINAQKLFKDEFEPENPKDFIVGFDLVNEEDTSRALKEYAPLLLKLREENPDFRYFLHCGESLSVENDNLIDAYLLGSSRVGHGLNLYRYPGLLRLYAKSEICLEVCLISNQTLRYTYDLRLHPGAEYLKRGVPLVLCSDDPVYQEHEALTDDFFAAICAWGLGVAEIKQLCINSITYSALDSHSRHILLQNWHKAWNEFVAKQLAD